MLKRRSARPAGKIRMDRVASFQLFPILRAHSSKLQDLEFTALDPAPDLAINERPRGLVSLQNFHHQCGERQDDQSRGQCYRDVHRSFDDPIEGVLEWFKMESEELQSIILKREDRMMELLIQVAQNHKTNAALVNRSQQIFKTGSRLWKLEKYYLSDVMLSEDGVQFSGMPKIPGHGLGKLRSSVRMPTV